MSWKVSEVLKEKVKKISDADERADKTILLARMGKRSYLFKYSHKTLSKKKWELDLMTELCDAFPELKLLRQVKEHAEIIYDACDRKEAEERLDEWLSLLPEKPESMDKDDKDKTEEEKEEEKIYNAYKEMRTVAGTMVKLRKYTLNYFDFEQRYTNAAAEGVNSKIKKINSEGRGYSVKTLRHKILFYSDKRSEKNTIK